jgi:hypothetical protein
VLLVQRPSDLALLKTWRRRYDAVQIQLPALPDAKRARTEKAIKDYFACGCMPARWAAIIIVSSILVAFLASGKTIFDVSWDVLLIAGLVALFLPLGTMLATFIRTRQRLWRTLDALARSL